MGEKPEVWPDDLCVCLQENIPIEEVFENLRCTKAGLTTEAAEERLVIFGNNKLEEKKLIYEKLLIDIPDRQVLLLDPILGTGNSTFEAISLLIKKGVSEANMIFLNLISAPQGMHAVYRWLPRVGAMLVSRLWNI